jgi:hypothetical protein
MYVYMYKYNVYIQTDIHTHTNIRIYTCIHRYIDKPPARCMVSEVKADTAFVTPIEPTQTQRFS